MFVIAFLVLVAVWIAAGKFLTTGPDGSGSGPVGQVVLPVVLIGIGFVILIEGGAVPTPTARATDRRGVLDWKGLT